MVQRVTVENLCDFCFADGKEVEGEVTEPITWGRAAPRRLTACEVHRKDFDALKDLLMKYGQPEGQEPKMLPSEGAPVAKPKASGDVFPCPFPGCPESGTESRLKGHVETKHGASMAQIAFENQQTVKGEPIQYVCREGDCKKRPSGFGKAVAVVQHLIRHHQAEKGIKASDYAV